MSCSSFATLPPRSLVLLPLSLPLVDLYSIIMSSHPLASKAWCRVRVPSYRGCSLMYLLASDETPSHPITPLSRPRPPSTTLRL